VAPVTPTVHVCALTMHDHTWSCIASQAWVDRVGTIGACAPGSTI
jgi:hypothetical protein